MKTFGNSMRNKVLAVAAGMLALLAMQSAAFAQIPPPLPQFTLLHSFTGGDGFGPMAGVIQGNDGAIYGTTSLGGGGALGMGMGTVFRLDPTTSTLTSVHTFNEFAVYGQVLYSGVALGRDGLLYGSTYSGGTGNLGTLYRVAPNGQNFASLYSFSGATDGASPDDLKLTQAGDGLLYGTTSTGGTNRGGTLFRLDPATLTLTTLYSFSAAAGGDAGLILGRDGNLYGTTYSGGANGAGSVFRFDPGTSTLTTLHDFTSTGGQNPVPGALIQGSDGNLYGTTQLGGGYGTVYKLNPNTGAFTTLHAFSGGVLEGRSPLGGVTEGGDGYLYGTTYSGGANGAGSVFRFDPGTATLTTLHDFTSTGGQNPVPGALMQGSDGNLYGTTQLGGGYGTVYKLNPNTGAFTTLHAFSGGVLEGRAPLGGVTEGGDGFLYGTTVLGGQGYGTVFRVRPTGLDYSTVVQFGNVNGRSPSGNLLRADDGSLYGVTRLGGAFNGGTVYRLSFAPSPDTTPPAITSITANPSVLRHDNRKIVPVKLTVVVTDAVDPAPTCKITGVTSNQSITGDWVITGDLTVSLRAEHTGRVARVYTIAVQCADASGNVATGTAGVTVPK